MHLLIHTFSIHLFYFVTLLTNSYIAYTPVHTVSLLLPAMPLAFFYCIYRHMMSIVYNLYSILLCAKYHFQCKNIVQAMYHILQSNVSVAVFRVDVN